MTKRVAVITPYVDDNADFRTFTILTRPGIKAGVHGGELLWVGEIKIDMNNDAGALTCVARITLAILAPR